VAKVGTSNSDRTISLSVQCVVREHTVDTNCLYKILYFLKNDECTALQGSNLVTDSGRKKDFPVREVVQTEYKTIPAPPPQFIWHWEGGGGVLSPSAKSASSGEVNTLWTGNEDFRF
jgi:hypothetical protein